MSGTFNIQWTFERWQEKIIMGSIGEQPRHKIINEGTILTTCPHAQTSFMISMREFPVHPRIHREVQSSAKFVTLLSLIKLCFPVSSAGISVVSSPAFCQVPILLYLWAVSSPLVRLGARDRDNNLLRGLNQDLKLAHRFNRQGKFEESIFIFESRNALWIFILSIYHTSV